MNLNNRTTRRLHYRLTDAAFILMTVSLLAMPGQAQTVGFFTQPVSQTNPPGFTVYFGASCSNAVHYQWLLNGQPVSGPSYVTANQELTVISAQPSNTGPYQLVISNSLGSATSVPVSITLSNAPTQTPNIQYSVVASLNSSTTGALPETGVIQGTDGFLYGVTQVGAAGYGSIFKLSTNGTFAWVYSFNGANGQQPVGQLVQDTNGFFYGTTSYGGLYDEGAVFRISSGEAFSVIHNFTNNTDGGTPLCGLCIGSDGFLYGDTSTNSSGNLGGTVFKMDLNGNLLWSSLLSTNSGDIPNAGLVQGPDGNLYGTASADAKYGMGSIFMVTPGGNVTNIYSFTGGADGGVPYGALVVGHDSQLYGTTSFGSGTIFKVTTNGVLTTVYTFDGTNGYSPQSSLFLAADGNFYGTTPSGGIDYPLNDGAAGGNFQPESFGNSFPWLGFGAIFQMTPSGHVTSLVSFNGNSTGAFAHSTIWQGIDGALYGTAEYGGLSDPASGGDGLVFRLAIPAPRISSVARNGSNVSLLWNSVVGEPYQVLATTNLAQPNWVNVSSSVFGTNGVAGAADTISNSQRFYRVLLP